MKVYDPNDPLQRVEIERRRERRLWWSNTFWPAFIVIVIIDLIVAADLIGNQLFYGDWTCAFSHCVRVQDVKDPRAKP